MSLWRTACVLMFAALLMLSRSGGAWALEAITVAPDQGRIEITTLGELYESRGDSLQIETAANADGTTGRLSVRASTPGTNPSWIVFALRNPTDAAVERWIAADRYAVIGSGVVWPDLDARRIETVTPSVGFVPERIESERADLFRVTLEPGQTITYVAELSSERYARIYLWKPLDYELKVRERQLFNGVMLGLTGLLAIFLTSIFAANHKVIFPAAALVAWCVLGYLCVDFGFFHKLFQLKAENNAVYRAACESAMAASLVIFLYFFLRIQLWHGLARMLFSVWIMAQLALVAVAVIDPRLASTFARLSFAVIGGVGMATTLFLALRGQDRALALIPTWLLLLVWTFGTAVTLTGQLSGDMIVSGLVAGLVLIVLLIGFTVTQFAFRSLEPLYGASPTELQLRSVAVEAAGAGVWEWSARRDEVKVSGAVEAALGLNPGELNTKVEDFCHHVHPADRERFRLSLVSNEERGDGRMQCVFRLRHADNSYRWYEIEASAMPSSDGRTIKSVGLLRDVTDQKRGHERLLHDAVKCSLTGLPNRQLLLDRLSIAMQRARSEPDIRPTVLFVDLDKFKSVNSSYGVVVGDSLLLTVARRLQRNLEPEDTLARLSGDRFVILLLKERPAADLAALAERVRRSLRSPIKLAGQDIVLTGSVGIAIFDGQQSDDQDLLREAETAMYRAKRGGADRIEIFRSEMRGQTDERSVTEAELRRVIEKSQLKVIYQPIVYMPMEELAGFEAIIRIEHPKHGLISPFGYLKGDTAPDLMQKCLHVALARALKDCAHWQKELPRAEKALFVNLCLPEGVDLSQELAQDIRQSLARQPVAKGSLKIGVPERLVMENPERATESLEWLRGAGAELMLEGFGAGYSSILYMGRLPFESVRIDRERIAIGSSGGETSADDMLRAMTALTHELGRKVVVEGVESDADVSFLRSIDCEYGQGFHYGDPLAEREVLQLLKLVRKSERRMQPRGLFRPGARRKSGSEPDAPSPASQTSVAQAPSSPANGHSNGHVPTQPPRSNVQPQMAANAPGHAAVAPPPFPAGPAAANGPETGPSGRAPPPVETTIPLHRNGGPQGVHRVRGLNRHNGEQPPPAVPPHPNGSGRQPGADNGSGLGPLPPLPFAADAGPPPTPAMDVPPVMPPPSEQQPPAPVFGSQPPDGHPMAPFTAPVLPPPMQPLAPGNMAMPLPPPAPAPGAQPHGLNGGPPGPPPQGAPVAPPAQPPHAQAVPLRPVRPMPNFDKLPPNIAASLQRLAGANAAPPSLPLKRTGTDRGGTGGGRGEGGTG